MNIQPELTMSGRPSKLTSIANSLLSSVSGPLVSAPSRKLACLIQSGASYQFRPEAMSRSPSPSTSKTEAHSQKGPNQYVWLDGSWTGPSIFRGIRIGSPACKLTDVTTNITSKKYLNIRIIKSPKKLVTRTIQNGSLALHTHSPCHHWQTSSPRRSTEDPCRFLSQCCPAGRLR